MVITGQVLSVISRRCNISMIISSLSAKKFKVNFEQISRLVLCAIQNGNKFRHNNSATFNAKKKERNPENEVE